MRLPYALCPGLPVKWIGNLYWLTCHDHTSPANCAAPVCCGYSARKPCPQNPAKGGEADPLRTFWIDDQTGRLLLFLADRRSSVMTWAERLMIYTNNAMQDRLLK